MHVLAISGSTRKNSYNTSLLNAMQEVFAQIDPSITFELMTLNAIPMFNQDLEENLPVEITDLMSRAKNANAFIISTPEYGNMVPGAVKNVTEWLSRKYAADLVKDKPIGIVGASDGGFGTARAQNQLLLLAVILRFKVNAGLRLPISHADKVFNEQGRLIDDSVRQRLEKFVTDFIAFCK